MHMNEELEPPGHQAFTEKPNVYGIATKENIVIDISTCLFGSQKNSF